MAAKGVGFLVVAAAMIIAAAGATLKFDAPQGWVSKAPASSMRVAEFTLPKTTGDAEDATLGIFFFGGQGGNVQANLERWIEIGRASCRERVL